MILAAFVIMVAAIVGIGLVIRRALGLVDVDLDGVFLAFWTGYGVALLVLILWSLVLPVGVPALIVIVGLGGIGLAWNREGLANVFARDAWRPSVLQALLLIVGALWVADQALASFQSWDGGLYHIQAVAWAKLAPVVPGIANLHGPLGFNNASFLYDAMLDSGWLAGRGFHVANGVLVLALLLQGILAGARFAAGGRWATGPTLFRFLLLAPAVALVRDGAVASYSTDIPATSMLLVATAAMFELLEHDAEEPAAAGNGYQLVALSILFAAVVCVKLSTAVFVAVAMPVAVFLWWRRSRERGRTASTLAWVVAVTLAFAVPWLARGVVMSGYPLFPLSIAGLPVDWRVPIEHAQAELAYIGFTEREFTWRFVGGAWLRLVLYRDIFAVLIPGALAGAAVVAMIASGEGRRRVGGAGRDSWWLLLPLTIAIGAWMFSAPSTRYSPGLFWTLAVTCVCECWRVLRPSIAPGTRRWGIVGLAMLGISPPLLDPAMAAVRAHHNPLVAVLHYNFITPGTRFGLDPMPQPPETTTYTTHSGLTLNVPKKPEGGNVFAKCWTAPIPCTSNPAPNLQLRQPGRLEGGFRVEGGWQMEDWPYYWQPAVLSEWRMRRSGV
jgi:hypothetical protein